MVGLLTRVSDLFFGPKLPKRFLEGVWLSVRGMIGTVGVTRELLDVAGPATFIALPKVGQQLLRGSVGCILESSKGTTDVVSPAQGRVTNVNRKLAKQPSLLEKSAGEIWLWKMTLPGFQDYYQIPITKTTK